MSRGQKIESQEIETRDQKYSKKVHKIKTNVFHVIKIWSHEEGCNS
jgi:hypothetical protein